MREKEEHY